MVWAFWVSRQLRQCNFIAAKVLQVEPMGVEPLALKTIEEGPQ
jgi:hypothetical protein